ncbi:hypothetical protein FKV73_02470 [Weissella paramesenteroides]|nr:hypothetical protein FKV79_05000 [Weissella paramesenteroides]KAA8438552.1 hypothetical protein FKV73_02470 [Weissella paramesenteroides]
MSKKIPKQRTRDKKVALPKQSVTAPDFTFKTYYRWLTNIKDGKFTNYHQEADSYAKDVTSLIHITVPLIYEYHQDIFKNRRMKQTPLNHSHLLTGDSLVLVKKIVNKFIPDDIEEDFSWWQVGSIGGCRIIGIYRTAENSFYPLFVDWHHLLIPDKNYNQIDVNSFKYDPNN